MKPIIETRNTSARQGVMVAAAVLLLGACSGTDTVDPVAAAVVTQPAPTTAVPEATSVTSAPPAEVVETTQPAATPATAAPATTAPATTAPATTEPDCDGSCPPSPEDLAAIEGMVAAYNAGDWDAWLATLTDDAPAWLTPVGDQSTALVGFDFAWSAGLNEVWTLGDCVERSVDISCAVTIEDDFHRSLAHRDLVPSECRFAVAVEAGRVDLVTYDLYPCHEQYDSNFHVFGSWFAETYPNEDPIGGIHYRGWNQPDVTAADRAREAIPEFVEYIDELAAQLRAQEDDTQDGDG